MTFKDVRAGNFIPELFHCSGFAVMNSATTDGTLYHGRVLDYAVDWQLQDHAVLIVCEPAGEIPFVNVSYAGFVGSVTGMNAKHVSIGEMGGRGWGIGTASPWPCWCATCCKRPATSIRRSPCFATIRERAQYFYVIADGNTNRAVGLAATWEKLDRFGPARPIRCCPRR